MNNITSHDKAKFDIMCGLDVFIGTSADGSTRFLANYFSKHLVTGVVCRQPKDLLHGGVEYVSEYKICYPRKSEKGRYITADRKTFRLDSFKPYDMPLGTIRDLIDNEKHFISIMAEEYKDSEVIKNSEFYLKNLENYLAKHTPSAV